LIIFQWFPFVGQEFVKFEMVVIHYSSQYVLKVCDWIYFVQFTGFNERVYLGGSVAAGMLSAKQILSKVSDYPKWG
jgi:hypothetical protein